MQDGTGSVHLRSCVFINRADWMMTKKHTGKKTQNKTGILADSVDETFLCLLKVKDGGGRNQAEAAACCWTAAGAVTTRRPSGWAEINWRWTVNLFTMDQMFYFKGLEKCLHPTQFNLATSKAACFWMETAISQFPAVTLYVCSLLCKLWQDTGIRRGILLISKMLVTIWMVYSSCHNTGCVCMSRVIKRYEQNKQEAIKQWQHTVIFMLTLLYDMILHDII